VAANPTRRQVLQGGALAAVAGLLAACTGGSSRTAPTSGAATSPGPSSGASSPTGTTTAAPDRPTFVQLAPQISGGLLLAGQPGFDPGALLYNPRFAAQTPPQAIARCLTADDVAACVRFAAAGGAPLRIRNGGHSYGGWSSGPGLVADLSGLSAVTVDAGAMTATVGAGALLAEVYQALDAQGVSIGAGSCATVGVTGLTLGGGVGVLCRAYGLACDQVQSFQVVTADGTARTVSASSEPDLFFALRGGGGSFAAVTSITFAVRTAPTVGQFFLQWPLDQAPAVLAAWQQWIAGAPNELWSTCKLLVDPGSSANITVSGTWIGAGSVQSQLSGLLQQAPAPATQSTSSAAYGDSMLGFAGCSGEDATACIADALTPDKRQPFAATSAILQQPLPAAGIQAIVAAVQAGASVPGMIEGGVSFDSAGGAIAAVAPDATAVPWRTALATVQYTATWAYADASADPSPYDAFVQGERAALAPWLGSGAYANYADPSLANFAQDYWGANLPRLQQVRKTYDPNGVFDYPQAVPLP
jgi:FAD/FMN-containing dehydrogenase